jgi:hypothetical protein
MGLDRFANFISKSINNDGIEDIIIDNNIKQIIASHVIFDLNFLIYQEIITIENEINDIIKIILCLPFSSNKIDTLEILIQKIFTQDHWKQYYIETDIQNLFDGNNEDEIINKFLNYISKKIIIEDIQHTIIDMVIYERIIYIINKYIINIHNVSYLQNIILCYDGIPSISKIFEQRRRRIKNYLESVEKKQLFKKYFSNMLESNKNIFDNLSREYLPTSNNVILFNYFSWLKYRYSIDKSIGPSCEFIINFEKFIKKNITKYFPKVDIDIISSKENGEADLKIFKNILVNNVNGDYSIHTSDSDFMHQILVQQTYFKIINKDINLTVIKYLRRNNNDKLMLRNTLGMCQIIDANNVIKNILENYNTINSISIGKQINNPPNYKIIWDLCLIFLFFGNDHIPSSIEIGPELGMEYFMRTHYIALNKNNIINMKKSEKPRLIFDMNNLYLFLNKINENKNANITKIILQRFFKINNNIITLLVDRFNYNFNNILEFMRKFIIYRGVNNEILDIDNMKFKLTHNLSEEEKEKYKSIDCFMLSESNKKLLLDNITMIEENIDYYDEKYMGLILYNKSINITTDPYQDIYNYINDMANSNLQKKYPYYYDHIDIDEHLNLINMSVVSSNINDYMKKIYQIVITQFGNMSEYHTDNLTYYKYNYAPLLDSILMYYSNMNDKNSIIKTWTEEINNDNIKKEDYLNSVSHHLLITPFIMHFPLPDNIIKIKNEIKLIENLWLDDINNFKYRELDINMFLKNWEEALIRININDKTSHINNELINLTLDFV